MIFAVLTYAVFAALTGFLFYTGHPVAGSFALIGMLSLSYKETAKEKDP